MKRYMTVMVICGCLLIGSLYPGMLLKHHVKLVDEKGNEITSQIKEENIPVKLEFRFLKLFQ